MIVRNDMNDTIYLSLELSLNNYLFFKIHSLHVNFKIQDIARKALYFKPRLEGCVSTLIQMVNVVHFT